MKRIIPLFTASALAFTLAACSSSAKTSTTATTAATGTATTVAGGTATTTGTTGSSATSTAGTTGSSATTTAVTTGSSATTTAGSTAGSANGNAADEAAAAAKRVAPLLAPVTKIAYTTKLTSVPAKGKKVYWLEGNIQSILPITGGFKSAAAALGWNLTVLTYDPSDPQGPNAALQQAVDAGADFIAESGQNATTLKTGLAAAKAKNIPVFGMFGDNDTDPSVGLYSSVGGPNLTIDSAQRLADFFISDSKAAGKMVIVNLPDFKILQIAEKTTRDAVKANCTACTVDAIEATLADLTGGNVTSQVVSYLQSHKDVKYVDAAIGDLATGLPQALKAAGMTDVKVIGSVPNVDQIQSLLDKTTTAWLALPRVEGAWQVMDAMARYSEGMDYKIADTVIPRPIFTQDNVASPATDYAGVPDFEAQFKALWGV